MKTMSAKDAKNAFGRLIDTALAEPVTVEQHGRGVVVVVSAEADERLKVANPVTAHRASVPVRPKKGRPQQ